MLRAYRAGLFPMAETRRGDRLYWLDPEQRGVLPLDGFHLPRRLLRTVLSGGFEVSADRDFAATIAACAEAAPGREDTWINPEIERLFTELHRLGHAHSVECRQNGRAGRRAVRRRPGRRVLRREHVQPGARRLQGGAGASGGAHAPRRLPPARHPVRHHAISPSSAPSRSRAIPTRRCWRLPWTCRPRWLAAPGPAALEAELRALPRAPREEDRHAR